VLYLVFEYIFFQYNCKYLGFELHSFVRQVLPEVWYHNSSEVIVEPGHGSHVSQAGPDRTEGWKKHIFG